MWEPTPYDQDPFDPGDGPPTPIWALHVPGEEAEATAGTPALVETAAEDGAGPEPAVAESAAGETAASPAASLAVQPPRTVLRRLSQLVAPVRVEPQAQASELPAAVDRMENALIELERQISPPSPPAEGTGFLLPNLMERIRSARLKAAEPVAPESQVPVAEEAAWPPAEGAACASGSDELELPVEAPAAADLPLFMLETAGAAGEDDPGVPPFPGALEERPPSPLFLEAVGESGDAETTIVAAEEPAPALPVAAPAENRAASRHLESLMAALDGEMADHSPAALAVQTAQPGSQAERYVVFQLGQTRYGLAIGEVLEMATVPRTTPLPNVPEFIRGVANLRGEVLAVIDLRTLLTLEGSADHLRERLLVVRAPQGDAVAGFIVDSVRGLARLEAGAVRQPSLPLTTRAADFLQGVSSHEDQALNILDTHKLFTAPEIAALSDN